MRRGIVVGRGPNSFAELLVRSGVISDVISRIEDGEGRVRIHGVSEYFDDIPDEMPTPLYVVKVERNDWEVLK